MSTPPPSRQPPTSPVTLFAVALSGILAGALLGGGTNAVSAAVSPDYFVNVLRWDGVRDVWRAAVAQGLFEGLLFGVFFSLVFTAGTGILTRAGCDYRFAVKHLLGVVAGALACWALGGLAAMGLATLSPEFYRRAFRGVPDGFGPLLGYAWVGGSIWGLQLGGLVSVVLVLVLMRANWQRREAADGPAVNPPGGAFRAR